MSALAAPLALWDVKDVEALVRKVVDDRLRSWGARLTATDHEDLVSFLIGQCWELSCRYDPKKDRNPNFGAYSARILTLRVADWYRQRFGDTRHGGRPVLLSLDAPASIEAGDEGPGGGRGRLVDTLASLTGDPAEDRSPDLVGVLDGRGREGAGPHDSLAEPASRGAARRDRGATQVKRVRPAVPPMSGPPQVETPVCEDCAKVFLAAFRRANKGLPESERLSDEEIQDRACFRAQAVKFMKEWICPRCTRVRTTDGSMVSFQQLLPSRQARREAERVAKRKGDENRKQKPR